MFDDEDMKKNFEKFIQEFQKMLEGMMENFDFENMDPNEIMKNIDWEKMPKFKTPFGEDFAKNPFMMGFSVNMGPDGKPRLERFGNKKQEEEKESKETNNPYTSIREPLVDVLEDDKQITLICEVPGVEKEDIKLKTTSKDIEIRAGASYHKKLTFTSEVIPQKARAKYKNGILEIKLPKK